LRVSVFSQRGRLGPPDLAPEGQPPGVLRIIGLPGKSQMVRVSFNDGPTGPAIGALRVTTIPGEEVARTVTLGMPPDRDSDRIADEIDNCLMEKNPDQSDSDENGSGDACPNQPPPDLAEPPDLGDMAKPPCTARFCDDFEDDTVKIATLEISSPKGTQWQLGEIMPPISSVAIDTTMGALGSSRSLRFDVKHDVPDMGSVRYFPYALLYAANLAQILQSPMYLRFFARTSRPPSIFNGSNTSSATINWGNLFENLTLFVQDDGISWMDRFTFTSPTPTRTNYPVSWTADWVCIEWKNENLPRDMSTHFYQGSVKLNGTDVGTFSGGGVPALFGGIVLGPDVEIRSDIPGVNEYTMWFDEVIIDDKPIGCTRRN
jgi:hypothetical protein